MKYMILFVTLLSITTTWAIRDEVKGKRDAPVDYSQSSHSSLSYQSPSLGQEESNAISVGAGYSVGGGKPSYSYATQEGEAQYQQYQQPEGLSPSSHGIQLSALQSGQGGYASNDLSELMNQISHGINSGAIVLPSGGQGATYQLEAQGAQGAHGGQVSLPQFSFGAPKYTQYNLGGQSLRSLPSYSTGSKGLGNFGSTGPVLFSPQSLSSQSAGAHAAPSSGHSYQPAAVSFAAPAPHSYPGFSLGGGAQSLGASYKSIGSHYPALGKDSFKPSVFLGASSQSDSGHGPSSHSPSYSSPSFASYQSQSGSFGGLSHGPGGYSASLNSLGSHGGPPKQVAQYSPEGLGSLESFSSVFSNSAQFASPPRTTHGTQAASYTSNNAHAASVSTPQFYISSSKYPSSSSFGSSSSFKAPAHSHSSFSSGPKYSFGGQSSHYAPKDIQGSYSEPSYNTIKYSEELKPRMH